MACGNIEVIYWRFNIYFRSTQVSPCSRLSSISQIPFSMISKGMGFSPGLSICCKWVNSDRWRRSITARGNAPSAFPYRMKDLRNEIYISPASGEYSRQRERKTSPGAQSKADRTIGHPCNKRRVDCCGIKSLVPTVYYTHASPDLFKKL